MLITALTLTSCKDKIERAVEKYVELSKETDKGIAEAELYIETHPEDTANCVGFTAKISKTKKEQIQAYNALMKLGTALQKRILVEEDEKKRKMYEKDLEKIRELPSPSE